ncbi:MAG TPA: ATP-binding protein [Microvirga sp.]|nr:ATP-binding protein [Microvirga sp.]
MGIEITTRILAERREAFRIELDERLCGLNDPREIIATANELLGRHLAADRVGYAEIDANDFTFQIEDDWTNGRMPSLSGRRRLDEFGPERIIALRAGRALAFEERPIEPPAAGAGIVPIQAPIRAGLTVPLVRGGRFAAALYAHCREPRRWTDDDMELAREAAEATWSAVERARAEAALEETEARLRALTDNLPLGIVFQIATGRDGSERRFLYVSENHERLTGIPAAAVRADPSLPYRLILPEHHETMVEAEAAAVRDKQPFDLEVQFRRADGEIRWARIISAPREQADGSMIWDGIQFDITGQKHAEIRLRELNETLEERVAARTAELVQAQEALAQAQKMEAVGQLTGGIAHDFNNLLTIIKSSTDLLRRPDLAEERRQRYVDAIADTVERGSKLTGQLLAFARRQALKPEVFDVPARVRALSDMLLTIVGARIQVVTEIACDRCFVEADITQFETALVNMAVNARDAMEGEGTLTMQVRTLSGMSPSREREGRAGAFVAVSISDTGSGIAPDKFGQIFEPFYTTKEVGKGTGLGLSQVYGFAKQSGGDIAVESQVGRGATFTLYLPQVERKMAEAQASARGPAQEDTGDGRRVLVVEDNVGVGTFSTQMLQDLGYETTWAANADEALALLAGGLPVDVVFSDVLMPGKSGIELGQEIRRLYPGLPVILTSGYSHELVEEGRRGFELLQKPYPIEELSRLLHQVSRRPDATGP